MSDVKSLAHNSIWRCSYHIVFAPKQRRQDVYKKIKPDVGKILRELSERNHVEVIAGECCLDYVHLFVSIPPTMSVSKYMGYLKSKSSLVIYDRFSAAASQYGDRRFWCKGYYVDTEGKFQSVIQNYIRRQLEEDVISDQYENKGGKEAVLQELQKELEEEIDFSNE